jgi:hypothetical protein
MMRRCGAAGGLMIGGVVVKRRSAEDAAGTEAMCMCVEVWMRTAAVGTLWHLLELIARPGAPTNAVCLFFFLKLCSRSLRSDATPDIHYSSYARKDNEQNLFPDLRLRLSYPRYRDTS